MIKFCCKSIRSQILLLILLMALLPIVISISHSIREYRHYLEDAEHIANSIISQILNDQRAQLTAAEQLATTLSLLPAVQSRDSVAINSLFAQAIKTNSAFVEISILDASGYFWASTDSAKVGLSHADRQYFKNTVASGKVYPDSNSDGYTMKMPTIALSYPIKDRFGAVRNVCVIAFGLERYRDLYQGRYASPLTAVLLADQNGTILFSSTDSRLVGKQDRSDLFKQMAEGGESGSFDAVGNLGVRRLYFYKQLLLKGESSPYMYARSGLSRQVVMNKIYTDLGRNSGIFLLFIPFMLLVVIYVSKRGILDKIADLQNSAHSIAIGNFGAGLPDPSSENELDQLGFTLMEMSRQLHLSKVDLQKSRDDYRELVENANSIILKWDAEGRIQYINEFAEKLFGFSADELLGKSVIGTIVPETETSGRDLAAMIRDISKNPELYLNNENENICKGGERLWISWSNRELIDVDGKRLGILSIGQNNTQRRSIEHQLIKSEERFRSIVENVNDVVFALTLEGVFNYVSPRWQEAFGYEISETVGKPFALFVHPDDVAGCFEFLQKVMVAGQKQDGVEYRVLCKDGRYLWYTASGSIIPDPEQKSLVFIGVGRDISERKKAEESLRQSEEKFSAAFHASPDAITLTRLNDGIFIEVNEGFTVLTGYSAAEVVGKQIQMVGLLPNSVERERLANELETNGEVNNRIITYLHKDGSTRTGQLSSRVIQIEGAACLLTISRDITEHEYLQRELIKAQKLESISVLAGGIAHNFNNVLTGVIGYISYAKKHLDDPGKVLPILESAEKSSYRAAGLARQLLTFSKGGSPVRKPVSVNLLVQESVSLFLTGTNVKGSISCGTQVSVLVDSQQISQAFNNIILNAVHAMPEGGTLTVLVDTVLLPGDNKYSLKAGNYVKIVFEDSGCGIDKKLLHRVYDPYYTTKESGTGLGLSTTFSIIDRHDGHIDITSEVGKGTVVAVLLPSVVDTSENASGDAEKKNYNLGGISVLVMDDEDVIRELAESLLEEIGCEVSTCDNGTAAVQLYSASMTAGRAYSVVILDLLVPGSMGGIETAKRILELDPDAKLIVSSGYSSDPAISEYNRYGFSGSISKPYNATQLLQAVASAAGSGTV